MITRNYRSVTTMNESRSAMTVQYSSNNWTILRRLYELMSDFFLYVWFKYRKAAGNKGRYDFFLRTRYDPHDRVDRVTVQAPLEIENPRVIVLAVWCEVSIRRRFLIIVGETVIPDNTWRWCFSTVNHAADWVVTQQLVTILSIVGRWCTTQRRNDLVQLGVEYCLQLPAGAVRAQRAGDGGGYFRVLERLVIDSSRRAERVWTNNDNPNTSISRIPDNILGLSRFQRFFFFPWFIFTYILSWL